MRNVAVGHQYTHTADLDIPRVLAQQHVDEQETEVALLVAFVHLVEHDVRVAAHVTSVHEYLEQHARRAVRQPRVVTRLAVQANLHTDS